MFSFSSINVNCALKIEKVMKVCEIWPPKYFNFSTTKIVHEIVCKVHIGSVLRSSDAKKCLDWVSRDEDTSSCVYGATCHGQSDVKRGEKRMFLNYNSFGENYYE